MLLKIVNSILVQKYSNIIIRHETINEYNNIVAIILLFTCMCG